MDKTMTNYQNFPINTTAIIHVNNLHDSLSSNRSFLTLEELSERESRLRLPTVIYLCILTVFGIIGNTGAFMVYIFKYPPSNFRTYALCLGLIDILACFVAIPAEIYDNHSPYMFYSEPYCKSARFIGNFAKIGSTFVITIMAIERYRKVCHPFTKPCCQTKAGVNCAVAIFLTFVFSWPQAVLSGIQVMKFDGNVTGYDCSLDSRMVDTVLPFTYTAVQLALFLTSFVILIILYSLIILTLWRQSQTPINSGSMRGKRMAQKSKKITKIMIAISVGFVLSFLPHFVLKTMSTFKRTNELLEPSPLVLGLLPLLSRSYFLNNVINPVIYYTGDEQFRQCCFNFFKKKSKLPNNQVFHVNSNGSMESAELQKILHNDKQFVNT